MAVFNITDYTPSYLPCRFAENQSDTKKFQMESAEDSIDVKNGLKEILTKQLEKDVSHPEQTGGVALTRMDVNGLINLATDVPYFLQCGGYFTFDKRMSDYIGGYPKDAILIHRIGNEFHYVQSLKDDNRDDFVENPAFVNGISWRYCDSPLIYPDYSKPVLPDPNYQPQDDEGEYITRFLYGIGGNNGCVIAKTLRGNNLVEFGPKAVFDNTSAAWHSYQRGLYHSQTNKAVYFRVRPAAKDFKKPPEFYEGKAKDAKVTAAGTYREGARLFLTKPGWFYLSLAHLASSNYSVHSACGNLVYTYTFGFPDNAVITMREVTNPSTQALKGPYDDGDGNLNGTGRFIVSSSYANSETRHQAWAWSMQMITRANTLVQIWNARKFSWDMSYNLFEFKR